MNGKIKSLSPETGTGFIAADGGIRIGFDFAAVVEYDAGCLAIGQAVTFDAANMSWSRATNVHVERRHHPPLSPKPEREELRLRFMGFEQMGSTRCYRFDRISRGAQAQTVIVTADLALFRKHGVNIQEGPALCLHALSEQLDGGDSAGEAPLRRSLSDEDMRAHVARRPAPRLRW